ncbi:MAG: cobalamin biosynthesis protein [Propionibacteriaceae bacterium]|jgi:cobalt-precorrin 5A hydrolase|nr:cobalamin biosynthesis protein [Propionibacteriaceae bacterium]
MRIAAIAFTDAGCALGRRLQSGEPDLDVTRCPAGGLADWTRERFASCDALLFIGSVGIAVRAVASLARSKASDPAVVVIDEQGQFAIPVLSGHIGQANALARRLARAIGAKAVVTTATDLRGLFAVDDWAVRQGLRIANPERVKTVSAALLAGRDIRLAAEFPIAGTPPRQVVLGGNQWDVFVTCRTLPPTDTALHLVPPVITAGVGCRKGTSVEAVEAAFSAALAAAGRHRLSVAEVCSVDLKADEPGLAEFCARHGLPFRTFAAASLAALEGDFAASEFVATIAGVDNVCERAAVLGGGGYLVARKAAWDGVTVALALREPSLCFDDFGAEEGQWAC